MKFTYRVSIFVMMMFLGTSCGDSFLNVTPEDRLSDGTFWKTEADADMALTGLYNRWEEHTNILWWDLMTDNGYSQFPWDGIQVMGNGQLNASDVGRNLFNYSQIRKCNNFLEKISAIDMDQAKKKRYIAEARFLRAYDYFRKVQFYGDVPLLTEVQLDAEDAKMKRSKKEEVVSFILAELAAVALELPVQNMRQSGGHITSGAALALKARLELYEGKFAESMADAKKVMEMADQGIYQLYTDYYGLFQVDNESKNNESILEVFYIKDTYANNIWQHVLTAKEGGWSSITAVQSLVDEYEMSDGKTITESTEYDLNKPFEKRDPRLRFSILYPGQIYNGRYFNSLDVTSPDYHQNAAAPRSGYNVRKYSKIVPPDLFHNGDSNVMVIRLAEVLLTFAEAGIEQGQITPEVYSAIDQVRQRAGMPVVNRALYNSQSKMRELVRRERRVELAFEGLRYWDIKRWNLGDSKLNGPLYGSRRGSVNSETGAVTWNAERIKLEDRVFRANRNYLFPIPQAEMDANPQMKQNEGY